MKHFHLIKTALLENQDSAVPPGSREQGHLFLHLGNTEGKIRLRRITDISQIRQGHFILCSPLNLLDESVEGNCNTNVTSTDRYLLTSMIMQVTKISDNEAELKTETSLYKLTQHERND